MGVPERVVTDGTSLNELQRAIETIPMIHGVLVYDASLTPCP
jgi:hypothetical protein